MDLQKEREAFEAWLFRGYPNAKDFMIVYRPDENIYEHRPTQVRWEAWQAAKAQAVPEGYVLMPIKPTETMVMAVVKEHEGDAFLPYSLYDAYVKQAMIEAQEPAND